MNLAAVLDRNDETIATRYSSLPALAVASAHAGSALAA
jgi:hypothetical protein